MTAPQSPAPAQSLLDEMAAALERVRQACLFDDDNGRIGVTNEPHISNEQFNEVGLVLARYRAAKAAEPDILKAIRGLNEDSHHWSTRPCPTCGPITEAIGEPFGCYFLAEQKHRAALAAAQAKEGRDD